MPDTRRHRGAHPQDRRLFGDEQLPTLRRAVEDLSLLLSRGYADAASLKLVCDHFSLTARQRSAVMRASCSDAARDARRAREMPAAELRGAAVAVDGYNVLTTVEAALAGGVVLLCRDGTYRDIAGMHGTYRKVDETVPAVELLGRTLADLGAAECAWYLDSPVSNSGRLATLMREIAAQRGWPWRVELAPSPDRVLIASPVAAATSDSAILDRSGSWVNLALAVITRHVPDAWRIDLSSSRD